MLSARASELPLAGNLLRLYVANTRIKQEFENGREYYAMHGKSVREPHEIDDRPSIEALRKHNEKFVE